MKVAIMTVDTDYHQYLGTTLHEFESIDSAKAWCIENSFCGERYTVDTKETRYINETHK